jgi:hypothetical protein
LLSEMSLAHDTDSHEASSSSSVLDSGGGAVVRRARTDTEASDEQQGCGGDDDEDSLEDVATPYNFGRSLSVAKVTAVRTFLPSVTTPDVNAKAVVDPFLSKKHNWSLADEIRQGLKTAQQITLDMDLANVITTYCVSNCLIVEFNGPVSEAGDAGSSVVFTGTLKHAATKSKYVVSGDCIFEWVRGAAASGYVLVGFYRSFCCLFLSDHFNCIVSLAEFIVVRDACSAQHLHYTHFRIFLCDFSYFLSIS